MPGPHRGPGRGPRKADKPKDLFGTWKKLLAYLSKYHAAMIIALICAVLGTLCTLAGPNQLSDMTDAITAGIAPDTEAFEKITKEMTGSMEDNLKELMPQIAQNLALENAAASKPNEEPIDVSKLPQGITQEQIEAYMKSQGASSNKVEPKKPEAVDFNGVKISVEDQKKLMELSQNSNDTSKMDEKDAQKLMEEMPQSIKEALISPITVNKTEISRKDQLALMDTLSGIDMSEPNEALKSMDELPESVYGLVKPKMDMDKITHIGLILVSLFAGGYLLSSLQGWIMATLTQRASKEMRQDIDKKINRLPISYFEKTTTGDILSRITNDVDTIGQSLNQSISTLLSNVVMLIGSLVLMLTTNLKMTLTAVVASLIGFVIIFLIMGRSQKYFFAMQNNLGKINGHIEEIYSGHTVVKAYNGEKEALNQFDAYNKDLVGSAFKATMLASMMQPIMGFIGNFGYVAICVVGGAMVLNGEINFGVIVAFMMYVRYFTQPLSQIAQAFSSLQSAAAAGERVFGFLEAKEMADESDKTAKDVNIQGNVDFSHVRFRYPDSNHDVIHDFSADAKSGQKIAIVGPTGAGKTTLVNLLMRFYEINGGEIEIDGINTKDMKRSDVHSLFCMVLQDTWLFEGTIRENLIYNTPNVSEEQMKQAAKAVGLDHFIHTLPHGYDTVLNDQLSLSAGQKQQLTIARAMIANRPMLILDEATSSVDTRTEQQIQNAMDQLMDNRTSFVIAHRLSTIKNADLILVLNHGDIVETGTHEELLEKGGFYADLYNSQFDDTEGPDLIALQPE